MKDLIIDNKQSRRIATINEFGHYLRSSVVEACKLFFFVDGEVETTCTVNDLVNILNKHKVTKRFMQLYNRYLSGKRFSDFPLVAKKKQASSGIFSVTRALKKLLKICDSAGIEYHPAEEAGDYSYYFKLMKYDINAIKVSKDDISEHLYEEWAWCYYHRGNYVVGYGEKTIIKFTLETLDDFPDFMRSYFNSKFQNGLLVN